MHAKKEYNTKTRNLFVVLVAIFLTNALIAEFVGVKIFSLEAWLKLPPAQLPMPGNFILDFNLTAGVLIWPVVFILTDVINEYFGKKGVRFISFLAAGCIAYSFVVIWVATELPPANFWLKLNSTTPHNQPFNINYAFSKVFTQGLGIIIGSLTAFLIGQLADAYTFRYIKKLTGSKKVWLRATGSTVVSQLIDSFVVLGVAFYLFGNWSLSQVVAVGIVNYIYKFAVAVLLTPLLYVAHHVVDAYLGKAQAHSLANKAME